MNAPVKDRPSDALSKGGIPTVAELRSTVNDLAKEIAAIAEKRGHQVNQAAQAGTSELRRQIRRQPVISMGVAALGGALLALVFVPKLTGPKRSRWDAWMPHLPHGYMPSVTKADLYELGDSIQRSVARAASSVPLSSSFERLVDVVTKVEPTASMNSVVEKVGSWLQKAQSAATSQMKK